MGARHQADRDARPTDHAIGEGEAEPGSPRPVLAIRGGFFAPQTFRFPLVVTAPVDRIHGVRDGMQRFLGHAPFIHHIEAVDQLVGRLDVFQVTHALHIRLPGQNPQVADQEVANARGVESGPALVEQAKFDIVGTAEGETLDTGLPLSSLANRGRLGPIESFHQAVAAQNPALHRCCPSRSGQAG